MFFANLTVTGPTGLFGLKMANFHFLNTNVGGSPTRNPNIVLVTVNTKKRLLIISNLFSSKLLYWAVQECDIYLAKSLKIQDFKVLSEIFHFISSTLPPELQKKSNVILTVHNIVTVCGVRTEVNFQTHHALALTWTDNFQLAIWPLVAARHHVPQLMLLLLHWIRIVVYQ